MKSENTNLLHEGNKLVLDLVDQYQNLETMGLKTTTPYFINSVEQIYKRLLSNVGIDGEVINNALAPIRRGETMLGAFGGKGSPSDLESDIERLFKSEYPEKTDFSDFVSQDFIHDYLKTYHIGLDCSGLIYNITLELERNLNLFLQELLAWSDRDSKRPSHAGTFIFDSPKLKTIFQVSDLQPLDLLITSTNDHIGIVVSKDDGLCLLDSSMGKNIAFSKLIITESAHASSVEVKDYDYWTKQFSDISVTIKRFPCFDGLDF